MQIEWSVFKVKEGKSQKVEEWLSFLQDNKEEVLLTLEQEKMYVEAIFRGQEMQGEFLYWFSIQGKGGTPVEESAHYVDQVHLRYWEECIDESWPSTTMSPDVSIISPRVAEAMTKR